LTLIITTLKTSIFYEIRSNMTRRAE